MWMKSLAAALLTASCMMTHMMTQPAGAVFVTLDEQGGLFAPYWCDQTKLVKAQIDGLPAKYVFEGPCSLTVKFAGVEGLVFMDVPVHVSASYDGARAKEIFELGGGTVITSERRCEKDPFQVQEGGASCLDEGSVFSMSSQFLVEPLIKLFAPTHTPIMIGRATPEKIEATHTGQAGSRLTAGSSKPDLTDWNPFGQEANEPATIEVSAPATDEQLPPNMAYQISLTSIRESGQPASALLQIERLEEFKGGDIAPPAGKTHWWQAKWSGTVDWNELPLHIGRSKSTQGLAQAGLYRVRARAQDVAGDLGGWTSWRAYCLGNSLSCGKIEPIRQIGNDALKAMVQSQKDKITRVPPVRPLSNESN